MTKPEKSWGEFVWGFIAGDWLGIVALAIGPFCPRLGLAFMRGIHYPKKVEMTGSSWSWAGFSITTRFLP